MEPGYEDDYSVMEESHPWFVVRRELFAALAGRDRGARILDVGCGTGIFLVELKRLGYAQPGGRRDLGQPARQVPRPGDRALRGAPRRDPTTRSSCSTSWSTSRTTPGCSTGSTPCSSPAGGCLMSVPAHPSLWSRHDELNRHCRRYRRARAAGEAPARRGSGCAGSPTGTCSRSRRSGCSAGCGLGERKNQLEIGGPLAMRLYGAVLRLENRLLRRVSLPLGVSLIAVAEKGDGPRPK